MEAICFVVLVGFFPFVWLFILTGSSQCQAGHLEKEAGRPRRVLPQQGTDPRPHQQHRLAETEPELVLLLGPFGSSRHSKWWTRSRGHPWAPGRSKSSQGQRQGWSTGPRGPFSRWLPTVGGPRTNCRWSPALLQHSSDQSQQHWADPKWSCGQEVHKSPRWSSSGRLRLLNALRPLTIVWLSRPLGCLPLLLLILENFVLSLKCDRKSRSEELKVAVLFQVTRHIFSFLPVTHTWRLLLSAEFFKEYL